MDICYCSNCCSDNVKGLIPTLNLGERKEALGVLVLISQPSGSWEVVYCSFTSPMAACQCVVVIQMCSACFLVVVLYTLYIIWSFTDACYLPSLSVTLVHSPGLLSLPDKCFCGTLRRPLTNTTQPLLKFRRSLTFCGSMLWTANWINQVVSCWVGNLSAPEIGPGRGGT